MQSEPLVSILIPCWGCREYIAETIRSALAQSYEPLEILVVEDCGNDGTYEEALKFNDPRLRVIRNERNFGQYGNKNEALRHAKGELIKYLDGDDILEPDCVARLVESWRTGGPGVAIVFGQFTVINREGRQIARPHCWGVSGRCRGTGVLAAVTRQRQPGSRFGNVTPHLISRAALEQVGGFPHDNAGPGDVETFMKLLCAGDVCFVEEPVARYRLLTNSMASKTAGVRDCIDYVSMVERLEEFYAQQPEVPAHLRDERFLREWRVWAGAHAIMAHYQRKLRGASNQFEEIRQVYMERGLEAEFRACVRERLFPYTVRTLVSKFRRALRIPQHPVLFTNRDEAILRGGTS